MLKWHGGGGLSTPFFAQNANFGELNVGFDSTRIDYLSMVGASNDFLVPIPPPDQAIHHLIAVVHGAAEYATRELGDRLAPLDHPRRLETLVDGWRRS